MKKYWIVQRIEKQYPKRYSSFQEAAKAAMQNADNMSAHAFGVYELMGHEEANHPIPATQWYPAT